MSAVTVESPIPASAGLDAYGYGGLRVEVLAQQRAEQARRDRVEHLAAIDGMHAYAVDQTLTALRVEAEQQEHLLWSRVRTMTLDLHLDPEPTLGDVLAVMPEALTAALIEELALYGAELAAQPYRRETARAALDNAWVTARRAYLDGEVAA